MPAGCGLSSEDGTMNLPNAPLIVLTRPLAQSRRFAKALRAALNGRSEIIVSPLTRLVFLDVPEFPQDVGGLIFTSETGVKAYTRKTRRRDLPAWVVGPRTASAARAAGLTVQVGPGDAAGLAQDIAASGGPERLLYVRGRDVAYPMEQTLVSAGITIMNWVAYEQRAVPPTGRAAVAMSGRLPVILPLFSVLGAQRATGAFADHTAPILIAAMSKAVAAASADLPTVRRLIAARPDEQGMLEAIRILADAGQRP